MQHSTSVVVIFFLVAVVNSQLDPRWKLLWSDEFDGTSLDTTKWTARTQPGYSNNGELEYYVPEAVSVSDGNLMIKSYPDPTGTHKYLSGFLDTSGKFSSTYGRFEVRAKLTSGKGMWPAHWLLSEILCWPLGAEFDIMENIGDNNVHGTYHWGSSCGDNHGNGTQYASPDPLTDYHIHAIEWFPGSVTWYLDTTAYKVIYNTSLDDGKPWTMDVTPHYWILNTAVGGYWPGNPDNTTVFPQYHVIDYVRTYGWEPCVTGCQHGCCEQANQTCKCDGGYSGTYCEFTQGTSYKADFSDTLSGNAENDNGQLKLTVTADGCPDSCAGGKWTSPNAYGAGNFTFLVKGPNVSGTALLLWGTNSQGSFLGFQMGLGGADTTSISFQYWYDGGNKYASNKLPFDHSQDFHTYTVAYGLQGFAVYADDAQVFSTDMAPSVPLQLAIDFEGNANYFGPINTNQLPTSTYANAAGWFGNDAKAVCDA